MAFEFSKMSLASRTALDLNEAHINARSQLFSPDSRPANMVGTGVGVKWTDGEPTGEPALLVLVTHKADRSSLRPRDIVPAALNGIKTDVVAVGHPFAGAAAANTAVTLSSRIRPVRGGFSIGHKDITAGTIAAGVYDILPGGQVSPPTSGIGMPSRYYVLSNNHILANGNAAAIGDPILQPGPYDGGTLPQDQIATLTRFIPISFAPDIPLEQHNNIVDCAVAEIQASDVDRDLFWIGRIRGWRPKANVTVGTLIQKVGRSSSYTTGRIIAVNTTIDIGYGGGRGARFFDQIITTAMSTPGDSGSLIATMDGVAVGLLCAGSPTSTIVNQIENIRSQLWVEVAEQVL